MDGSEYLQTCAEIGVALAGFAALAMILEQRPGAPDTSIVRVYVATLIERGLAATFLALLPSLLEGIGIPIRIVWLLSSGSFAVYGISLARRAIVNRKIHPEQGDVVSGTMVRVLFATGFAVIALQAAHAFGIGIEQNVWWYAVGIVWLLASAGYLFFFVVRAWVRGI
jgi:hypothetical protein